jgi:hypothetical protein
MKMKKYLSIIICFAVFMPSFAGIASANGIAKLCLNSGIAAYYESLSNTAFKMVNVVFQDFLDTAKQTNKKESPVKQDEQSSKSSTALLPDTGAQKNLKTGMGLAAASFDTLRDVYTLKITGDGGIMSSGWMILLVAMLLICVRKKDDYVSFINYFANKHPIAV